MFVLFLNETRLERILRGRVPRVYRVIVEVITQRSEVHILSPLPRILKLKGMLLGFSYPKSSFYMVLGEIVDSLPVTRDH
jgi:hypothetical protein